MGYLEKIQLLSNILVQYQCRANDEIVFLRAVGVELISAVQAYIAIK